MEQPLRVRFLTTSEVSAIHAALIELYGGQPGSENYNLLDSAVQQPRQQFSGKHLYPSIHLMAATYLFGLICNHPFLDGNKRTASKATLMFYAVNGYLLLVPEDEFEEFVIDIAIHKPERHFIAAFLAEHTRNFSSDS